jgi:hypothetical protein
MHCTMMSTQDRNVSVFANLETSGARPTIFGWPKPSRRA